MKFRRTSQCQHPIKKTLKADLAKTVEANYKVASYVYEEVHNETYMSVPHSRMQTIKKKSNYCYVLEVSEYVKYSGVKLTDH